MTRSEWETAKTLLEERLAPFTRAGADGQREVIPHPAVRSLSTAYAKLIEQGLRFGWLALTDSGQVATA